MLKIALIWREFIFKIAVFPAHLGSTGPDGRPEWGGKFLPAAGRPADKCSAAQES